MADFTPVTDEQSTSDQASGRQQQIAKLIQKSKLRRHCDVNQLPIVYDTGYDISFCGLEKVHPFDAGKWGRIIGFLSDLIGYLLCKSVSFFLIFFIFSRVLYLPFYDIVILKIFSDDGLLRGTLEESIVQPLEATTDDLLIVHTKRYLNSLKVSFAIR